MLSSAWREGSDAHGYALRGRGFSGYRETPRPANETGRGHFFASTPLTLRACLPAMECPFCAIARGELLAAVQRIARAMETGLGADGSFVAVNTKISQSVPHLHVHVVPRRKGDGLRGFFWPRTKYESDGEREEYAQRIREALR